MQENRLFINNNNNNKNNPVGGKTNWQEGKARQDTRRTTTTNQHWNCKHKEIIKRANEEGNEGEQLGKLINKQVTRWVGSRQIDMRAHGT